MSIVRIHGTMKDMKLDELRSCWAEVWGREPHARMGRKMLEKSLAFKTERMLNPDVETRLEQLVKQYKRNPKSFDEGRAVLKPGTRLVRTWKGKQHSVMVKTKGYEYEGQIYHSLSKIANDITGSRWNGWTFFGLRN